MLRASTAPNPEAKEADGEGVKGGDAARELGVEGVDERITGVVGPEQVPLREGNNSEGAGSGNDAEGT